MKKALAQTKSIKNGLIFLLLIGSLVINQVYASNQTVTMVNAAPTVAASNLHYTNVGGDRMTVRWTPGNGTKRIVIFRQGSAVTATPTNGQDYVNLYASLSNGQRIIYNGTGDSVVFSNSGSGPLSLSTTYYFAVFEYNGSGSSTQYLISPYLSGSKATLSAAGKPTVAASSPVVNWKYEETLPNSTTRQKMGISWNKGDGAGTVIIMRLGSPVDPTVFPADGSNMYQWQRLANSQVVCYRGTGNYMEFKSDGIGNLVPGGTYYFAFLQYNGSGVTSSYLTSTYVTFNATTLINRPTTSSSSLVFSNVQTSSMTATWTKGNGTNRIVVARVGSPVTSLPTDGASYGLYQTVGAAGNIVVYNGAGNTFNFTTMGSGGLTAGTTYYLAIFEYNGSLTTTSYLSSTYLTGNQATTSLSAKPTVSSSNLIFSNIQTTSMTVAWTSGNGANRIVIARAGSAVSSTPTDGSSYSLYQTVGAAGNIVVYNGSGNTFNFTTMGSGGLTAGTTYYLAIFEYNGSSTTTSYLTTTNLTGSQSTAALSGTPTVSSSNLVFSNVQTTSMTATWTNGNGANRIVIARAGAPVSSAPVNGTAYSNYQSVGSSVNKVVYNGSGNTFNFTTMGSGALTPGTTYYLAIFEYNGSGGTTNYLTSTNLTGNQTTVSLAAKPTVSSSSLLFSNIHSTSMVASWTNGDGAKRLVIARAGSAVTGVPVDGSSYSLYQTITSSGNVVVYNGAANTFNFTSIGSGGLTPNTTYYLAIYEYNGSGNTSSYLTSSTLTGSQTTLITGRMGTFDEVPSEDNDFRLAVYPVPSNGSINVLANGDSKDIELLFYNTDGELVNRMFVNKGIESPVDLSYWKRGVYYVKVFLNGAYHVEKIVLM